MRIKGQLPPSESISYKNKEAIRFVMKEDLGKTVFIKNKIIFFSFYAIGFILIAIAMFTENYKIIPISFFLPFVAIAFSRVIYLPIKKKRKWTMDKIYSFKQDRMGLVEKVNKNELVDYSKEFEILEWHEDNISPKKIVMSIPTKFDSVGSNNFMEYFNESFGKVATWVPDKSDPENPGWNFPEFKVTLTQTEPLPDSAMWSAHYVLNEDVSWSFFPLGIGSENGVRMMKEDGSGYEHVIGFDVNGGQTKLAKERGLAIGNEIVTAPMVLLAGGTGSGKALSVDTKIIRYKDDDSKETIGD